MQPASAPSSILIRAPATLSVLATYTSCLRKKAESFDALAIPKVSKDQVICFALYTVHNNILKLTAQLYPLDETDPRLVRLEAKQEGEWRQIASTEVITPGWTAPFRVENWDMNREVPYRVRHGESAVYEGIIRKNPVDKDEFVVVAFTGNSIYPGCCPAVHRTEGQALLQHGVWKALQKDT